MFFLHFLQLSRIFRLFSLNLLHILAVFTAQNDKLERKKCKLDFANSFLFKINNILKPKEMHFIFIFFVPLQRNRNKT